jgi:hypothetical protein
VCNPILQREEETLCRNFFVRRNDSTTSSLPHGEAFSCSVTRGIEDVCSDAAKHLKIFYKNK